MEKNERIMNVLEGLWSAHARSSPVSSPPVQSPPLESLGAGLPAEGVPALRPAQNMNKEPFFGEK